MKTHLFSSGPAIAVDLLFKGSDLVRVHLSLSGRFLCRWQGDADARLWIEWIESYAEKIGAPIGEDLLDLSGLPAFHRSALEHLLKIPFGALASYGEVAEQMGSPRAARAVGNACHNNPFPLLIPCHRVIAANGRIGGFAIDLKIKERLLLFESSCTTDKHPRDLPSSELLECLK